MGKTLPYVRVEQVMWNVREEPNNPPGWNDKAPYGVVKFFIGAAADE